MWKVECEGIDAPTIDRLAAIAVEGGAVFVVTPLRVHLLQGAEIDSFLDAVRFWD